VSAFALEDRVSRLRASEGVYSGVGVQVRVQPIGADRYKFKLNARSGGLDRLKMELTGQLERQGDAGTQVLIHPARPNYLRLYLAAILLVGLLIFAALHGGMMAMVVFGSAASASWLMNARKEDELTRLVRQTLDSR
jgi:hypothetical protein